MPRSIYQAGPGKRRTVTSPFQGRGSSGGGGGGGSRFRNAWGTGGNEGNFAGFEFDRWQALQRAGKDPSKFAQGVEDRFRGERLGVEGRQRSDRNRAYRRSRLAEARSRRGNRQQDQRRENWLSSGGQQYW